MAGTCLFFSKLFCRLQIVFGVIYCIGVPQFESDWLCMEAQNTSSDLSVQHGLGAVPGLVEVFVKAVDGPNKGFIFKAIGNGERDDDVNSMYGGVIYIYNYTTVRVMAPNRANNPREVNQGAAIYTGESPYWLGLNSQKSFKVEIKVRCWAESSLPAPCFSIKAHYMYAGSSNLADTYAEFSHYLNGYPMLVKVRARLTDGLDPNWYTDAQGSSLINFGTMRLKHVTGGLKYAYNHENIRIWTSSYPSPDGAMFTRQDGWGNDKIFRGFSTTGYIDVFAWCNLNLASEEVLHFGPSVTDEVLQIQLPDSFSFTQLFFTSAVIEAVDGPNSGYIFEGVGSAMTNYDDLGQPCAYGGLIYAHNNTTIRIWRPDHATGAAICIPDSMGFGTNSQASQNGKLIFRIFQAYEQAETFEPMKMVCSHFQMLGNQTAYNSTPFDTQHGVTKAISCASSCLQHDTCVTYAFSNDTCHMYNTTDETRLIAHHSSQVWTLKERSVQQYP